MLKIIKGIGFLWVWYCLGIGIAEFIGFFIKDRPIFKEQDTFIGTLNNGLALIILIIIYFIYEEKIKAK
jgi:hypothetical protein